MIKEIKTVHIWLPNGRSLCDRRPSRRARYDKMTDSDFEAYVQEQTNAPACGSCLILTVDLQHQACGIAKATEANGITPSVQTEAFRGLVGTGWDRLFDIEATVDGQDDAEITLAGLMAATTDEVVESMVQRCAIDEKELRESRARWLNANVAKSDGGTE